MPRTVKKPSRLSDRHAISGQLRDVIESRGLTGYALDRLADVDPGVAKRFLSGERDIRMETADRLAAALGLRLVEVGRARGRTPLPRPAGRVTPSAASPMADEEAVPTATSQEETDTEEPVPTAIDKTTELNACDHA